MVSTLALKGALQAAAPGCNVRFDATQALLKSLAQGERADVVILTSEAIDDLIRQGTLAAETRVDLGSSGVGIAVRAGAARPAIGTVDELKRALLAADSVAHSRVGASGLYFAELLERMGIAQALKKRVIVEQGPVGVVVASGGAEIGVQQLCELAPVAGIDIVGALPPEVQKVTSFSAAASKAARDPEAARTFLRFLRSDEVRAAMRANAFEVREEIRLRTHRPGDLGWIVHRHGELYHQEYGWDERFEALVAGVAARFVEKRDTARERCWIAELDGERVGSVMLVRQSERTAKLRLLLIEPRVRGQGLGRRLVEQCIGFAREAGYRRLSLWTQSNLYAARAIYAALGFKLMKEEPHSKFGVPVTGEYWELRL